MSARPAAARTTLAAVLVLALAGALGGAAPSEDAPAVDETAAPADTLAGEAPAPDSAAADSSPAPGAPLYVPWTGDGGFSRVPFPVGEVLTYSITYGPIKAGTATMSVESIVDLRGDPTYHLVSLAQSTPAFSLVYKVEDRVESFLDARTLFSRRYEKHLSEGDYRATEVVDFDHARNVAVYTEGDETEEVEVLADVQDVLSSLYYVRTLPLKEGRSVFVPNHASKKNYPLEVRVLKKEWQRTDAGNFHCYKLEPILQAAGLFKHEGKLTVWITADERRIPVLMKSKIIIGSVAAVLSKIEGHE